MVCVCVCWTKGDKYAAFLHDAVILYAIALNETFRKGQDVNSGVVIARNCRGKTFRGTLVCICSTLLPSHVDLAANTDIP